jgi:hypothetical protein
MRSSPLARAHTAAKNPPLSCSNSVHVVCVSPAVVVFLHKLHSCQPPCLRVRCSVDKVMHTVVDHYNYKTAVLAYSVQLLL